MGSKRLFTAAVAASACVAGAAYASHAPQLDPQTVPVGWLATHSRIPVLSVNAVRNAVAHGMEVSIQHNRFGPGEATAWHIHPGPTIVTVVRGAMTYQRPVGGACRSDTYVAGTGFTDRGGGKGHRAVAGSEGADAYVVFLVAPGERTPTVPVDRPSECPE